MNKLNYLKAVILLVAILIVPIKAIAAEKFCALGETCKVSCDYTLVIPITNESKATYQCHVVLRKHTLYTSIKLDDDAWWFDNTYSVYLPAYSMANIVIHDPLTSSTGHIKIAPSCYRVTDDSFSETIMCAKNTA